MIKNIGLREVYIADTAISDIDGTRGKLVYRGYDIESLAQDSTFEEVAYLLLNGRLPDAVALADFTKNMKRERWIPQALLDFMARLPHTAAPMDVLQSSLAILASFDNDINDMTREAGYRKSMRIIAKTATALAAWARIREGLSFVPPREDLSHSANLLYMLKGEVPDEEMARLIDVDLILQAEHQFNASTFTCRVVASTRAHIYACVAAGVGALSGPLHGGATNEVTGMLKEIQEAESVSGWVRKCLDSGRRVMGMGHAVYKTYDPRARVLKGMAESLLKRGANRGLFDLLNDLERSAREEFTKRGKPNIYPNVDFYSAFVNQALGIPPDCSTPVFTASRVAGWCAHIIEEKFAEAQPKPAIYRPQAHYVGPGAHMNGLPYTPIKERKPAS